jgi:hypothetical protein
MKGESEAAIDAHMAAPHMAEMMAATGGAIEADSIKAYEARFIRNVPGEWTPKMRGGRPRSVAVESQSPSISMSRSDMRFSAARARIRIGAFRGWIVSRF